VSRVFVTGMGIISAIGETLAENHLALMAGKCGIGMSSRLASRYSGILPFGEVALETDDLKEKLHATEPGITRTTLLALRAFADALADANLTERELSDPGTALVGATTIGGMCLTDELYRDATEVCDGSPYLASYDCASVHLYLQSRYNMKGPATTINTACSSSANAIQFGARLIRNGLARRAIVGGADSLAKFTINGFNALQILSPGICRPFDRDRAGLNLGEGAAFLVLEAGDELGQGPGGLAQGPGGLAQGPDGLAQGPDGLAHKRVYAELTGYCNVNDAHHPSSLSAEGDGPYLAMKGALESARLNAGEIDFINAHGTGTENNDAAESAAMVRLFGEPPAFASTKSNTGHTLGASGAIEAVFSVFNLIHQELYGSLNFSEPIAASGLRPVQSYQKKQVRHVLSNSFGFGGNCTSLVFSKIN
jgi:3-oxoacyl-(acyl-carrier-protein) synthase